MICDSYDNSSTRHSGECATPGQAGNETGTATVREEDQAHFRVSGFSATIRHGSGGMSGMVYDLFR
jgi:hypothetical protein